MKLIRPNILEDAVGFAYLFDPKYSFLSRSVGDIVASNSKKSSSTIDLDSNNSVGSNSLRFNSKSHTEVFLFWAEGAKRYRALLPLRWEVSSLPCLQNIVYFGRRLVTGMFW